ncbi:MAG: hypothetical protein U0N26_09305 [Faecalibacterium prausnitzii]
MKLKKLLALTLTGAVLTASLTACTPLDAAELVYDSIFGGGSSSTGSTGSGNNGSTAEDAENRAFAEAYVQHMQSVGSAYAKITPVYDIPHLEEFVKAIDEYCTKKGGDWEETVHELSEQELTDLATKVVLYKETYGSSRATLRFGKDIQGTPEQKANSFTRTCGSFWDTTQKYPYKGNAWFDSVVLTRADGSTYRFLLSICHG